MYWLMRKNGVLVHIDEKVGVEFIDMKRMNLIAQELDDKQSHRETINDIEQESANGPCIYCWNGGEGATSWCNETWQSYWHNQFTNEVAALAAEIERSIPRCLS